MSQKYPGGIISKTAPVPTGPYENGTAPGVWTLEQQAEFVKQGIWPIAGNVPNYIEDVFQTWLYTGNGSTQTINNGIDLAGKGGLVWLKSRDASGNNIVYDTARGATNRLITNLTLEQGVNSTGLTAFNSNGFTLGSDGASNFNGETFASWTFREQPKFFDVVTYTGTGSNATEIAHSLGSAPGMVVCKKISGTSDWAVWHRGSGGNTDVTGFELNGTAAAQNNPAGYSTLFTSTTFRPAFVGSTNTNSNDNGATYVAYLFAHNAGGFGLTGTDNVISCGSFTTDGSGNATVDLGYEPQWVLFKRPDATTDWLIKDTMRGFGVNFSQNLFPNLSNAEGSGGSAFGINATGLNVSGVSAGATYIYIAIRRGPMKVPTTGTSVFSPNLQGSGGTASSPNYVTNFPVDFVIRGARLGNASWPLATDRLRNQNTLTTSNTDAEVANNTSFLFDSMTGYYGPGQSANSNLVGWSFRRAPGFFDEVCYTGTGSSQNVPHNLGVAPQLIITKSRSVTGDWNTYAEPLGNGLQVRLEVPFAAVGTSRWGYTNPTATQFTIGSGNTSGVTFVAYLFASAPGVSKVGGYTGTGTTQVINCGFTTGARFVLIKRTDSDTGDWYVWDSARGIVAGNDPYLLLNSTAAEVTNTDYVDTASTGFEISSTAPAAINASGGTFIFLAIA